MKKTLIIIILHTTGTIVANGQCTADYSYSGTTDTLTFTNQSILSNAHFYWHFGDGSGSNDFSPVHVFPDDGKYLVTLYGVDTVSNCVDVKQNWIDVTKPDTLQCNVLFTDTIVGSYLQTTNLSSNCSGLFLNCHIAGPGQNYCGSTGLGGWFSSLFMHGMQAARNDSIYGARIFNAYYKTVPYNYTSSTNYQNCSANFEVIINYQPNGALVSITAMNKSGNSTFTIVGFGNPIYLPGLTVSYLYPYITHARVFPWLITHTKSDSLNGCSSVSSTQCILIQNPYYAWPANCVISQQPQAQFVNLGTTAQFIIDSPDNLTKQWQQDAGLGYVNLSNAGPFNGVNTDTLTISNVQLTMNNYYYRCMISDSSGFGCPNTSLSAALSVAVGINEMEIMNTKIYPNPVSNYIILDLPIEINTVSVNIYNVLGQEKIHTTASRPQTKIDLNGLANGVYLIEVTADHKVKRQMFIKQ